MGRMNKISKANLEVADRCGVSRIDGQYAVWVELDGNRAYLAHIHGPMLYRSIGHARRAVRRIRPDLSPYSL